MTSGDVAIPPYLKSNPIYTYIWQRLWNHNQSFLGAFVGPTGSGKSWSAVSMAYDLDRDYKTGAHRFTIDNVCFTAGQFLNLIRKDWKKGSFIVFDEPGLHSTGVAARNFMGLQNRVIGSATQSMRYKNLGVIYATTNFGNLDKMIRMHFNANAKMTSINRNNKFAIADWRWMYVNPLTGKFYRVIQRGENSEGRWGKIVKVAFPAPPKDLIKQYEERKKAFLDEEYNQYASQLVAATAQNAPKGKISYETILAKVKENPTKYSFMDGKGGLHFYTDVIANEFNVAQHYADLMGRRLKREESLRAIAIDIVGGGKKTADITTKE